MGGQTALMSAAAEGHTKVVERLLAAGADINAQMETKMTALMFAAQDGHLDTVNLLVARGAGLNVHRDRDGVTALSLAESMHHSLVAQRLRESGGVK